MADKKFPSGMSNLTSLENDDTFLISDSSETHISKFTTLLTLINKVGVDLNIDGKANQVDLLSHTSNTNNPHVVTSLQLNLDQVDNTSDLNKPISTATQIVIDHNYTEHVALSAAIDAGGGGTGVYAKPYSADVSGNVYPDIVAYNHFTLTMVGNTVINQPTIMDTLPGDVEGYTGILIIRQNAYSTWVPSFSADWLFPNGTPTFNTAVNAMNMFRYTVVNNGTNYVLLTEFVSDWIGDSSGGGC